MNTMPRSRSIDFAILALLALVMAATRVHHFDAVPDASWAVFFVGGFYLRRATAWAFPALMALAVFIDYLVITASGLDFMQHYCMSPGYWALIPAHLALWAGGAFVARFNFAPNLQRMVVLAVTVPVAAAVCHLFAQGGFYWLASSVQDPTVAGWWKNYTDWLPSYTGVMAAYVGVAALMQAAAERMLGRGELATVDARR